MTDVPRVLRPEGHTFSRGYDYEQRADYIDLDGYRYWTPWRLQAYSIGHSGIQTLEFEGEEAVNPCATCHRATWRKRTAYGLEEAIAKGYLIPAKNHDLAGVMD